MTHPPLSLVTHSNPEETPRDVRERRRMPRLNLCSEQFRHSQNGKIFAISDLSMDGMAIRILQKEDLYLYTMEATVEGTINLKHEKFRVTGRVKHVGKDLIGCQFESLDPLTLDALKYFLDPAFLSKEMKPIPSGEGGTLWYHAPYGTDLLLWSGSNGLPLRMLVVIHGTFIRWENEIGKTTGRVGPSFEASDVRGVMRFETLFLEPDPTPDPGKLGVAKTLILSSNLPQELKDWCVGHLDA